MKERVYDWKKGINKVCLNCGDSFYVPLSHSQKKYCSRKCTDSHIEKRKQQSENQKRVHSERSILEKNIINKKISETLKNE